MKLMIEPTTKIVELNGVPARIWEGTTDDGVPFHAYITRIAVDNGHDQSKFVLTLDECRVPSPAVEAIPLKMIL